MSKSTGKIDGCRSSCWFSSLSESCVDTTEFLGYISGLHSGTVTSQHEHNFQICMIWNSTISKQYNSIFNNGNTKSSITNNSQPHVNFSYKNVNIIRGGFTQPSALWQICLVLPLPPSPTFYLYRCAPVSMGNMFRDLPQLRETADNTERYI
jgi:hypothetical protein